MAADDDDRILRPHSEFVLPTTAHPIVAYTVQEFQEILFEDWMSRFARLPALVPAARIRYIELRRYESWKEWQHEFVVVRVVLDEKEYDLQFDRAWDTQGRYGWREYIPLPGIGSQKTAANEVTLTFASEWANDIRLKARFDLHGGDDGPKTILSELVLVLPDEKTKIIEYSLFGVNCWAWSRRFILLSVFNTSEKIRCAHLADIDQEVDITEVMTILDTGQWLRLADHAFGGAWLDALDQSQAGPAANDNTFYVFRTRATVLENSSVRDWFSGEAITDLSSHSFYWFSPVLAWAASGNASDEYGWQSFNAGRELLYLITPPIHSQIQSFGVMQSSLWLSNSAGVVKPTEAPSDYICSVGLLRQDSMPSCPLRVECPVGEGRGWLSERDHPVVQAFKPGDRLAVWVKTYPTICRVLIRVSIAYCVSAI